MLALEALPVPSGFLKFHPHPKQLIRARAGQLSPATRNALLRHYRGCFMCRDTQDLIDSTAQVANGIVRECLDGSDAFSKANLN